MNLAQAASAGRITRIVTATEAEAKVQGGGSDILPFTRSRGGVSVGEEPETSKWGDDYEKRQTSK